MKKFIFNQRAVNTFFTCPSFRLYGCPAVRPSVRANLRKSIMRRREQLETKFHKTKTGADL